MRIGYPATLVASVLAFVVLTAEAGTSNPYSPAYDHPYRAGVIPTYDVWLKMEAWKSAQKAATPSNILKFYGGIDGIGATSGTPAVYLVFYGNQWGAQGADINGDLTFSNDPVGAAPYLQQMIKGIGTGGELWSGTLTQYCDGPLVVFGATSCPPGAPHIGYPTGGALAGVWYDNSAPSPQQATALQLAQEAVNAALHFGNTTSASNRYTQYVIVSPTGTNPDGFNTPSGGFCAWHGSNVTIGAPLIYGDIAMTNLPYVYDAGAGGCSTNSVNGNTPQGDLDGFSIAEGHEYAEVLTDPLPGGGWINAVGGELADECGWGAHENVILGGKPYAMQALWSNDTDQCEIAHPIGQGFAAGTTYIDMIGTSKGTSNISAALNFSLKRLGDLGFEAALSYHTANVSAAAGFDYTAAAGNLIMPAGSSSASIPVILAAAAFSGAPSRTFQLLVDSAVGVGPAPSLGAVNPFGTGSTPTGGAATDVNRDGKLDLVVVNWGDNGSGNTISVLLNTTATGSASPTFAAQQTFQTDGGPRSLAIADLNGDGLPDVVVANLGLFDGNTYNGSTVSVLLNTTAAGAGIPSFAGQQSFPAGAAPAGVDVADINGDGKPDIVVANALASNVSVLFNTTATGAAIATFAAQQTFPAGLAPVAVNIVDINGDGRRDIVATDTGDGGIVVLLNTTPPGNATPSFSAQQSFATGLSPNGQVVADVNGDGKADVIAANAGDNSVSVLIGTTVPGSSSATFAAQQIVYFATAPTSIALADVNGDGKPDVLTANPDADSVLVLRNATAPGSSTAVFLEAQPFGAGTAPVTLVVGDMNGDGKPDVTAANFLDASASVLLNETGGAATGPSPGTPEPFVTGVTSASTPYAVAVGDVNGDGKRDLVVANSGAGSVSVLLNQTAPGAAFPGFSAQQAFDVGASPYSVAIADLNGDGKPDLVVGNGGEATVSVLRNTTIAGGVTPSFATQQTLGTNGGSIGVAVGDINGDGKQDLLATNAGAVSVLINTTVSGSTTFVFSVQSFGSGLLGPPVLADINRDGRPDVIVAAYSINSVAVLMNTTAPGSLTPTFAGQQLFGAGAGAGAVAAADINCDGVPDLLVTNQTDETVSALLNTTPPGSSTATFASQVPFAVGHLPYRLVAADVTGDGRPDVTVANLGSGASLLVNTTPPGAAVPSFAAQQQFNPGYAPVGLAIADFNGDGQPDLAVANLVDLGADSTVSVLLNRRYQVQIAGNPATGTIVYDYIFAGQFE